ARALLAQPRGRKVDGDTPARELELRRRYPTLDSLPRFGARTVRQADDYEGRSAAVDVSLDLDAPRLQADERMRDCASEHASTLRSGGVRLCAVLFSEFARRVRLRSTRPHVARCVDSRGGVAAPRAAGPRGRGSRGR